MDIEDGILLNFLEKSLQNLSIVIEQDDDTYINSPLAKRAKFSTPLTKVSDRHTKLNEHEIILDEMIMIMPNVHNEMKRNGHLKTWISLSRMVNDGSFPFNNIAFLLFMDVCRFLSCENTSGVRYSTKLNISGHIGYRLFHGKWLKFMRRPKHTGTLMTEQSDRGIFSPQEAKINFAVPILSVRSTELAPVKPSEIMPGTLNYLLDKVAESSNPSKTYKICFDRKKINASTSGLQGDIDLWGLEHKPTLKERLEQLQSEKDLIAEATETVSHVVSKFAGNTTVKLTELPYCNVSTRYQKPVSTH